MSKDGQNVSTTLIRGRADALYQKDMTLRVARSEGGQHSGSSKRDCKRSCRAVQAAGM